MKKYMIYALAACMTVLGAGCSKDFEDAGTQQTPVVEGKYRLPSLSASLDDDAETRTGEPNATTGAVNWTAKDRILIVRISEDTNTEWATWQYELVKGANSPIGEFEPIVGGEAASSDDPNFGDLIAVYPVSAAYVENNKLSFKINQNWYPEDEAATAAWKERLERMGIKTWNKDTQFSFKENDIKVSYKCTPTTTGKDVNSANFKFRQLGAWCKFEFDFSTDETYSQEQLLRIAVSTVDGTTNFTGAAEVDLTTDPNNPTLTSSGDGKEIDWTFNSGSNMNIQITRSLMLYPGELSNQRLKIVAETTLHTFTFYATPKQALKAGTVFHFPLSVSGFTSFGENDVDAAASKDLAYTVTDKAQIPFYYYGGTNCYLAMNGQPVTVYCTPYKTDAYYHHTKTDVSDDVLGAEYTPTQAKVIWYESALGAAPTVGAYDADNDSFAVTMPSGKYGNALVGVYNAAGKILWSYHIWAPEDDPTLAVDPDNYNPKALKRYKNTYSGEYDVMPMAIGATKVVFANDTDDEKLKGIGFYYQWGRKDPMGRPAQWNNNGTVPVTVLANALPDDNLKAGFTNSATFFTNKTDGVNNLLDLSTVLTDAHYMTDATATILDKTEVETTIDGKKYMMSADRYMIDQTIENPTKFVWITNGACNNDWVAQTNNYLWGNPKGYEYPRINQTYKSIFDPCPDGYRVAPKDLWINFTTTGNDTANKWELNVKGQNRVGQTDDTAFQKGGCECYYEGMGESVTAEDGKSGTYTEPENGKTDFYSASGYRDLRTGALSTVDGTLGSSWSSSPTNGSTEVGLMAVNTNTIWTLLSRVRAYGRPVRCVKKAE